MKQLIQSYRTGELGLFDVTPPVLQENGALVQTSASLVSAGTEKMLLDLAKKSLVGKAAARPDLVKQLISKMKQEGIVNSLQKAFNKLDTPIPLGYSCSGKVIEVGKNVTGISKGDRIACGGAGYANHSEINYIPKNLFVKIPDGVDDVDASFVTVGSIALQGVRQATPMLGERVAVIGLGLIGLLTVQILKANGCRVVGADVDPEKLETAKRIGADIVCTSGELVSCVNDFTSGYGVDVVIITASTSSNQPVETAGEIAKHKGRVVIVGMVGMNIPRNEYYRKELDIKLSMSYGPGRYDPSYEEKGIDYPFSHVRWTEQRNFQAFLELVAEKRVTLKELITHRFDFDDSLKAYKLFESKSSEKYIGIILNYKSKDKIEKKIFLNEKKPILSEQINVGLIGAGNFASSVILPAIKKIDGFNLLGLCTATGSSSFRTGKKYNFKYVTAEKEDLFDDDEINCIFITTRHNEHSANVIKALEKNKHVYVEKPLCISLEELEKIKKVYEGQGSRSILHVGYNRRFSPLIQKMQGLILDMPVSIIYRINAGIVPMNSWIHDPDIGGGRVVGEICHFIDTVSYLSGSEPKSVYADCIKTNDRSIPDEDNINIVVSFKNGSTASINYMAYGNKRMPKEYIEVFAQNISIQMNDFRNLDIFIKNKVEKTKTFSQDKGFKNEFKELKNAIEQGTPLIPINSIYKTSETTFKILESMKRKEVIEFE